MSTGKSEVKSCPIPTRVLTLKDWSQLPDCYSQTPGGTLFSTTPGGKNNYLAGKKKKKKFLFCFFFFLIFFYLHALKRQEMLVRCNSVLVFRQIQYMLIAKLYKLKNDL